MKASAWKIVRDSSGGVTVVAAACVALFVLLALLSVEVGMYLVAKNRAQNAADAAAIAAVQESFPLFSTGGTALEAARSMAESNGANLDRLEESTPGDRVEVEVSVEVPSILPGVAGIRPGNARATAAAEVDVEALLQSGSIWYTVDPAMMPGLRSLLSGNALSECSGLRSMVVLTALQHLGKPYVWGAAGPDCFDCSGLVCYVFAQLGCRLPRVTFSQVLTGSPVGLSELRPGDLVFFRRNHHVGIYVGGGYYIHAPRTGDVVKLSPLSGRSDVSAMRSVFR